MVKKRIRKFNGEDGSLVKKIVPAQVRTFVETVRGKRDPITEKDFTQDELKQARDAVVKSRERQTGKRFIKEEGDKLARQHYDETVDYKDYGKGLNEARQLATNPYGYFQTIKNSLIAAGFGPQIPSYDQIDQSVSNGGVPTVDQTATNIDLNGTPGAQNPSRTDNAGVVNTVGSGGNYNLINYQDFLNNLRQNGRQQSGF